VFLALFDVRKPYQGAKNVVLGVFGPQGYLETLKIFKFPQKKSHFLPFFHDKKFQKK